jgi:hypothetical protein
VDFRGGQAGLVRMELGTGAFQNSEMRIEMGVICPATVSKSNEMEGKGVLQTFQNGKG